MKILVINAGSSSLKYQLIDVESGDVIAKGLCERIGIENSKLTYKPAGKEPFELVQDMKDHTDAIKLVLDALVDEKHGVISDMSEIDAVGHRVVHGGEKFAESVLLTDEVLETIESLNDLAPLHNPANLIGHPRMQGNHAQHSNGRRFRHCVPSNNAQGSFHLRSSL